ncbi:hypothetical protein F4680DRAFT_134981 [Xylaria scruposa]|nr:hypothetical protein F4680DRAFT_134981 [Xylaria scruposa]
MRGRVGILTHDYLHLIRSLVGAGGCGLATGVDSGDGRDTVFRLARLCLGFIAWLPYLPGWLAGWLPTYVHRYSQASIHVVLSICGSDMVCYVVSRTTERSGRIRVARVKLQPACEWRSLRLWP